MGTQTAVFKAFTSAPADVLLVKDKTEDREKLWFTIFDAVLAGHSLVCSAREALIEKDTTVEGHSCSLVTGYLCRSELPSWKTRKGPTINLSD